MKTQILSILLLTVSFPTFGEELPPYEAPEAIETHPAIPLLTELRSDNLFNNNGVPIKMGKYIDYIRENSPELITWCLQKTINARIVISNRDKQTTKEAIDFLIPKVIAPHFALVDMQRMIRDIYREDKSKYKFDFEKSEDIRRFLRRELKMCLVNMY